MADDKLLTKGGHLIVRDGKLVTVDNGCGGSCRYTFEVDYDCDTMTSSGMTLVDTTCGPDPADAWAYYSAGKMRRTILGAGCSVSGDCAELDVGDWPDYPTDEEVAGICPCDVTITLPAYADPAIPGTLPSGGSTGDTWWAEEWLGDLSDIEAVTGAFFLTGGYNMLNPSYCYETGKVTGTVYAIEYDGNNADYYILIGWNPAQSGGTSSGCWFIYLQYGGGGSIWFYKTYGDDPNGIYRRECGDLTGTPFEGLPEWVNITGYAHQIC